MVWKLEKKIFDRILSHYFKGNEIHHFDFACGTGRILSYFESHTRKSVGCDVSPSMLDVARENNKSAKIIEADLTQCDVLDDNKFNLITAFRFFPNAEEKLRKEAMQVLSRHLDDNGYLIFNNHKNTGSTRNLLARLFGRYNFKGMSIAEVKMLLQENNLEIVRIYPLSIFPASESHVLIPLRLLRLIEMVLRNFKPLQNFGENLIFFNGLRRFLINRRFLNVLITPIFL